MIHDLVVKHEMPARVIAAENRLRNTGQLVHPRDVCKIVQIDVCLKVIRKLHVLFRRDVGRKHDVAALKTAGF